MSTAVDLPFVSVVVSFHNEAASLKKCLQSLLRLDYPSEKFEIILVDDGSVDESQQTISELIATHPNRVKLLAQTDKGPAAGRNLGIAHAKGVIVVFTDPDCIVDNAWLAEHVKHYAREGVGGVEGRVETDWDKLMHPIRIAPAGFRYVTCNISYRTGVLRGVGMFDENFRWKEDDELAYRVMKAGWNIASEQRAIVYHPVRNLNMRGLIAFGLKHRYDVLFYTKHPDVAESYFRLIKLGLIALTPEFFACCIGLLALFLVATAFLTNIAFAFATLAFLGVFAILQRRSMLKRRVKASLPWMIVFTLLTEIGRLWGAIKFRRFFL